MTSVWAASRVVQRAVWALVLASALTPYAGRAALDPSLRLYYDFESLERGQDGQLRRVPDRSPDGSDLEFVGRRAALTLTPTEYGHALWTAGPIEARVTSDGVPIHRPGEGVTLSFWAAGEGWLWPLHVGPGFGKPLIGVSLTLIRHGVGIRWSAVQDGDHRVPAFTVRVSVEFPNAIQWNHFAAVYDPRTRLARVYINGVEAGKAEAEGEPIAGWGGPGGKRTDMKFRMMVVPRKGIDWADPPVQYIDELRMYARALTRAEIKDDMRMRRPLSVSADARLATSWAGLKER